MKTFLKNQSHSAIFKPLAAFGRSLNRFYENRNHRPESNGELRLIRKLAELSPATIIDGGANVGNYSELLIKHIPNARIHAFEPVPDTFNKLKARHENHSGFTAHPFGLYSDKCSKEINLFSSNTHSSIYNIQGIHYQPKATETIHLIKGDDFLADESIDQLDFLKLDLEGAEYDALIGFNKALDDKRIRIIQFEYGYINITTKKLLIDFYHLFESKGYRIGKIFPKLVEFRKYDFKYEDFLGPNFIAVKEEDHSLIRLLEK